MPTTEKKRMPSGLKPLLLLLALSVTGCAAIWPKSEPSSVQLPRPPSLSTPIPSQMYLSNAQKNISSWRKQLMDTQLMQQTSNEHGLTSQPSSK